MNLKYSKDVVKVYDKLSDSNKQKIDKMNEKQLYIFMTKLWTKFGKQVRI